MHGDLIYGGEKASKEDKNNLKDSLDDFFNRKSDQKTRRYSHKTSDGGQVKAGGDEGERGGKLEEKEEGNEGKVNSEGKEACSAGVLSMVEVLVRILQSEDVLHRVRRFQTLDLLDVEGKDHFFPIFFHS